MTPVVRWLVICNTIVFAVSFLLVRAAPSVGEPVYELLALDPRRWIEWLPFFPIWQLVTYAFLHSFGSLWHIIYNLLVLYFFGTMLEGTIGARRFLAHYLGAVALGGLVQLLVQLPSADPGLTIGASGGALFVLVAMAVFAPGTQVILFFIPITLRTLALILVGLDAFSLINGSAGNTAVWVHLAGAAYGFAGARRRWIWIDPLAAWAERRARAKVRSKQDDEARLDELLERIHKQGMSSLSRSEREFLKRLSSHR
jgi:membrane associated rhomboid family serine protease